MQNNKIISIIVPIYNRGTFLPRCITSIINQSYSQLDIILVNDGSSDDSLDICNQYAQNDKRIRVISIPNSGVSIARNTGMQYAKGDFIQFVDSDDMIKPHMCQILMEEQQKNDADLAICGFDNIEINGNHLFYECSEKMIDTASAFFYNFGYLLERNLLRSPVNKLYKKEIINTHKLRFRSDFNIAEDALFNLEYYHYIQNVLVLPYDFYNCLDHNSENRLTQKFHSDYFKVQNIFFTKLIELLKEKNVYRNENKEIIKKQYANIVYMGIEMFKKYTQKVDYALIKKYTVTEIFPGAYAALVAHAKKNMAIVYVKINGTPGKKVYGLLKMCFWQCVEVYYTIKSCCHFKVGKNIFNTRSREHTNG